MARKRGSKREVVDQPDVPASWRKPPVKFTPDRQQKFLEHLRASGLKYLSAEAAGVTYETVRQFRKNDPDFDAACTEAHESRIDELEQAVLGRAIDGVLEPVIGGKDKDEIVTHIRRYSDGLAGQILKAKRVEYREKIQADVNITGGVLALPSKALSGESWEQEHGAAAKGGGKPE